MWQYISCNNQTDISSLKGIEAIAPEMSVKKVAIVISYIHIRDTYTEAEKEKRPLWT